MPYVIDDGGLSPRRALGYTHSPFQPRMLLACRWTLASMSLRHCPWLRRAALLKISWSLSSCLPKPGHLRRAIPDSDAFWLPSPPSLIPSQVWFPVFFPVNHLHTDMRPGKLTYRSNSFASFKGTIRTYFQMKIIS